MFKHRLFSTALLVALLLIGFSSAQAATARPNVIPILESVVDVNDISFGGATGWAVGDNNGTGSIYRLDRGSWQINAVYPGCRINNIIFLNEGEGYAVGRCGGSGLLLTYRNGGWSRDMMLRIAPLNRMAIVPNGNLWAVGDGGTIVVMDRGGWTVSSSPVSYNLNDITVASDGNTWAVGDGGYITYRNGQWVAGVIVGGARLVGISAGNASKGAGTTAWAVADNGGVYAYRGGGWQLDMMLQGIKPAGIRNNESGTGDMMMVVVGKDTANSENTGGRLHYQDRKGQWVDGGSYPAPLNYARNVTPNMLDITYLVVVGNGGTIIVMD